MDKHIDRIRELLDLIERESDKKVEGSFKRSFELFELPEIISSIVDYLQPLLLPYEAAVYWYLFRHSIVETGDIYVRFSTYGIRKSVITSSSGQASSLALQTVQKALGGLEEKGAIKKSGDTNREGTLYRVFLPEEIELCQKGMEIVQKEQLPKIDPKKELDFYNIKENRLKVFERDGYKCNYCSKQLTRFNATLDHIQPISKGGDHSYDNLITACLPCNSQKGSKPVMDAIVRKNG